MNAQPPEIVLLVEEPSMAALLEVVLPTLVPSAVAFRVIPHQGKNDLDRSFPRKLKAWGNPNARFIVLRDNDGVDCRKLKKELANLCPRHARQSVKIRLVMQMLESWILGDLLALGRAFNKPQLADRQDSRKFRNPDDLANASEEVVRLVPEYQKVSGAREVAKYMTPADNRSTSFRAFRSGLAALVKDIISQTSCRTDAGDE